MASVWNPENIRDVAESVGLLSLPNDVVDHLTRDVEFRIAQVLEEALKFMRHAKRKTLFTQDISQALRVLDVEPLYGYDSTRPLKFGEASIGPGQPLYYLEDEEVDFEKLINAPLPRVPREINFTAHWLAVEGVQPTIPQNPTPADSTARSSELIAKTNPHLTAVAGADISVKPQVKHILSKEMQLYFDRITSAILDESSDEYRVAALSSLENDPGLHQLIPYFVQFVADKVTHNLKSIFTLTQVLHLTAALLSNQSIYIDPYVSALVPPILTCLIGKRLGLPSSNGSSAPDSQHIPPPTHYATRSLAASILSNITTHHANSTPTLKPRLARALLKHLLATTPQPLGVYYGALLGLADIAGAGGVRVLIVPHLSVVDEALKDGLAFVAGEGENDASAEKRAEKRAEVEAVVGIVVAALGRLEPPVGEVEGFDELDSEDVRAKVIQKVGEVVGAKIMESEALVKTILALEVGS